MRKEYTCIICPNGCGMEAEIEGVRVIDIAGAGCPKGQEYVEQELTDPQRNIATSVLVENGILPLVSVRLTKPVPKARIFDVIQAVKQIKVVAPVKIEQVVIENILGLGSDVIATKNVSAK
ncbi:MAG: molybdopterin oxidoreductase [Firmicutes bacterium]|nr:molybdopterin oxidoreductase [Bacillota bacterium]